MVYIMIKFFFSIMRYPISIFMGLVTYNWLWGLDSYRIPILVKPIIDIFGWNVFFIICSIIVAIVILLTIMVALDEIEIRD